MKSGKGVPIPKSGGEPDPDVDTGTKSGKEVNPTETKS